MSNLDTFLFPSPDPPHTLTWASPMDPKTPIPFFEAASDTGKFVKAMVLKRDQVLGKNVLGATDYVTPVEVIETFKTVKKGTDAQFVQVDKDTYKGFLAKGGMPEFAQQELYENMSFMYEFGYFGKQSLDWSLGVRLSCSPPIPFPFGWS